MDMIVTPAARVCRARGDLHAFVIDSIKGLGINVPETCRLERMRNLFANAPTILPKHPEFPIALEAERDMQLLGYVFDQSGSKNPNAQFLERIKKMIKDPTLSQDNRKSSPGRDAVFELYVFAFCAAAGLAPQFEEPDITCSIGDIRYSLAAKRIKSAERIPERVKDARDQIERSRIPGVIILDTCLAFNPDNIPIEKPIPEDEFMQSYYKAVRVHWTRHHKKVQSLVRNTSVLGIAIHVFQIRLETSGAWSLAGMTMNVPNSGSITAGQQSFDAFFTCYKMGIPNCEWSF